MRTQSHPSHSHTHPLTLPPSYIHTMPPQMQTYVRTVTSLPLTHKHTHTPSSFMHTQMQTYVQTVVSTGGGVMQRKENLPFLHSGLIVWLDLPPDGIVERMKQSGEIAKRPLLANVSK